MTSRSTSTLSSGTTRRGFTMIEVLVVTGVFAVLAAFGLIVGIDTYARASFHSDAENAVALLQKARSEAINNINESPHGVYFGDASNLLLFRGLHYDPASQELEIEKAKSASYSDTCVNHEVVFSRLSGDAVAPCAITTASINAAAPTVITINAEGGIDW